VIAPYKYQWKRDGENLKNGNNKSYTTPPLRPEDFKAKYSVQIFGQDKIELSDEVTINEMVLHVDPITNVTTFTPVAKGTPVTNSAAPVPPFVPAPVKPLGAK
jgi:hypothetical protein